MAKQTVKKEAGNIIVYDVETTGLSPKIHGVCEVAMITLDSVTLEEVDRYEVLIAPFINPISKVEIVIDPYAMEINGLSESKLRNDGIPVEQAVAQIIRFIKVTGDTTIKKKPILCGHNIAKFDNPMMEVLFSVVKKDFEKQTDYKNMIDTMKFAHLKFPSPNHIINHKQPTVAEAMGIEVVNAHRAMPDVEVNAEMVIKMIKLLRGNSIEQGIEVEEGSKSFRAEFKF